MTDDPPPQYPDQNPSGWPPPAQPGPADEREQSSAQSDQTWYSTEPPTTIAPVPPVPPQAYPASPAYGQATPASPAYGQATPASLAYGQATPAYPASPAAYGYPTDPYTVPADPYPTTPYPPAPAPAGYPYGQTSAPPYGQPSGPPYGQVMQPAVAFVVAPPASGAATASMILGIVGLVFGCFLCGIPSVLAIIFGHIGLNQTKNDVKSGRGQAIAGLVMGYVLIVPTIIGTIFFLGYLGVFGAAAATSGAGY
jgi:hypothetical protein